jgi:putative oxidoreductase
MSHFMARFDSHAYALLRIITGFLFLWHGSQKLLGFPGEAHAGTPAMITYVAGPIELIGGTLILIGLLTRPAAFLCSGLMAAAYWIAHGTQALLPLINRGELTVLYCFVFLYISMHGAGIWSIDGLRQSPK